MTRRTRLVLLVVTLAVVVAVIGLGALAGCSKPAAAGVVYTCPMHPEVISDKPGQCPKCHMDLVKKGS